MNIPPPMTFPNVGEWKINEIKVRVISLNWAQIWCEKYEINAERKLINIQLNIIDRFKGITLEEKMKNKLAAFKEKLEKDNIVIRQCRELGNKF